MKLLFHVESSLSLRNDPMEIILFFEIRGNGFLDSIPVSLEKDIYRKIFTERSN